MTGRKKRKGEMRLIKARPENKNNFDSEQKKCFCLLLCIKIYYINTSEIPGFLLLLKNHIFIARSEDTIFIFHTVKIFLFDNIFLLSL